MSPVRVFFKVAMFGMAAGMLGVGCGGSDSTSSKPPTTTSSSGLASTIAAAVCENVSSCCSSAKKPFTKSACESSVESAVSAVIGADASATTSAEACVKAITAAVKKCDFTDWSFGSDDCTALFGAHLAAHSAEGDDCDRSCTLIPSGSGITLGGSIVQPKCIFADLTAPRPAVPVGSCFTNDGLYCDAGTKKCAAQVAADAACTADAACPAGFCNHGTCAALLAADASCSASQRACQFGTFCDSDVSICKTNHPDNGTCNFDAECTSAHCAGASCATSQTLLDPACTSG